MGRGKREWRRGRNRWGGVREVRCGVVEELKRRGDAEWNTEF